MRLNKNTLPAIIWAILIFIGSSIPSTSLPSFTLIVKDLVLHFVEYTIFGALLALAIIQTPQRVSWKIISMVLIIGIVYGASDEIHQFFVPGRFCSLSDWVADTAGVFTGLYLFKIVYKIFELTELKRKSEKSLHG